MTYTHAKESIEELGREGLEGLLKEYSAEVIEAGLEAGIALESIGEAYQGEYRDDEDFTQQLVEDIYGDPTKDIPFLHIDWEGTARDVMMDYAEENGHYFRIL